jgi:hypothetical protein
MMVNRVPYRSRRSASTAAMAAASVQVRDPVTSTRTAAPGTAVSDRAAVAHAGQSRAVSRTRLPGMRPSRVVWQMCGYGPSTGTGRPSTRVAPSHRPRSAIG